jgi:hypothetical protein
MELAIGEVLHELDRLSIKYRLRQQPAELGIWWTSATANEDIVDSQRLPA